MNGMDFQSENTFIADDCEDNFFDINEIVEVNCQLGQENGKADENQMEEDTYFRFSFDDDEQDYHQRMQNLECSEVSLDFSRSPLRQRHNGPKVQLQLNKSNSNNQTFQTGITG